jgi:hypothetical protein
MKHLILLTALALASFAAKAEDSTPAHRKMVINTAEPAKKEKQTAEFLLSPGSYLLIETFADSISVKPCEITKNKEGTFLTLKPGNPESPIEVINKPVRIFTEEEFFMFTLGPGDYELNPRVARGCKSVTYTGVKPAYPQGWWVPPLSGRATQAALSGGEALVGSFCLYKQ